MTVRSAVRRALTALVPGVDRFGLVLGLLVLSYLVFALAGSSTPQIFEGSSAVVALWLALHASAVGQRVRIWAAAMFVVSFLAVIVIAQSVADSTARGLGELWFVVVFLLTLIAVLRRVLTHQEVTLETIYGALSAYLLLGLMFSAVYGAMADLGDQQLFEQVAEPSVPLRQYFSFTTLTTLGYGDVTAATDIGRAVATLEAICGQIFLVTLIARLVANFAGRRSAR
jgi:hypothetical protein